ncbi:unnamed protein product [Miscanthus lutarioriparius]|uniref:GATA-type domain-containing protein n=1 Tax=Miscanthus lutarioriparius TaxID=422564 RepID=A0A811SNG8_9POAL|nr:unnamed protein product [Miscanthus lutarioriparius]
MRTQQPHASQRDVPAGDLPDCDGTAGACFPGRGLCCPDDPLDLVLQLFPAHTAADRAPPSSLAALGIGGGGGEPPRRVKQEPEPPQPQPLVESAYGGVGVGDGWDSWGLSSFPLEGLCGLEEIDVDMFFADDALDSGGGGEATEGNLLCDPTEAKPKPPAHITAAGGPVHTRGSLGGAVVPNDASPLPAPMPAGASPLQAYDACRAFDGAVFNNASASPPPATTAPVQAGGAPPVFVTNNSTPPVFVTNSSTPPLPALIMPAAPAPMPPAAGLHACGALPGIASNFAPAPPPLPVPMPAAGLHACGALPGIVSNSAPAPPPLMALLPARALHPNAAALAGVYSSTNAPAHAPPSATPSSSPPSRASSGSGRCPSSATSEPEFLQPHRAWVVPRKQRSPPAVNRRKRPWVLDFPLHALPPVAPPPPANPGSGGDDDDAKNRYALVPVVPPPPPGNTGGDDIAGGGGIRRRRPGPRQRNRQAQRVCSHCHSPETPQWRAGPDGPGTLCNACGIRYAANRLLPEYRPSTAPSFRSGQHSNRHRKVMKLREQQMKAATEEKPSEQQPMEDDRTEKDDDGFMGVCAYISAAGL